MDVDVPSTPTQVKTINVTTSGEYVITVNPDSGYNLSQVVINVNVPSVPTQTKSVTYINNGSYTVNPDSGYDLSQVNVDVDVSAPSLNLQSKSVTVVGTGSTSVVADSGYDGLGRVNVFYYGSGSDVPVIGNNPIYVKGVMVSNGNSVYDLMNGGHLVSPNNSVSNLRNQILIWYFDGDGLKFHVSNFSTRYGFTFINNFGFDIQYLNIPNSYDGQFKLYDKDDNIIANINYGGLYYDYTDNNNTIITRYALFSNNYFGYSDSLTNSFNQSIGIHSFSIIYDNVEYNRIVGSGEYLESGMSVVLIDVPVGKTKLVYFASLYSQSSNNYFTIGCVVVKNTGSSDVNGYPVRLSKPINLYINKIEIEISSLDYSESEITREILFYDNNNNLITSSINYKYNYKYVETNGNIPSNPETLYLKTPSISSDIDGVPFSLPSNVFSLV